MNLRKSKNRENRENTFPYLNSNGAVSIDGSLGASDPNSHLDVADPSGVELGANLRGALFPSGFGNTFMVNANTVGHNVLAGNS